MLIFLSSIVNQLQNVCFLRIHKLQFFRTLSGAKQTHIGQK